MPIQKIAAPRIFNGTKMLIDHVLVVTETGVIKDVVSRSAAGDDVTAYNGIVCPGFINAHCHLELSHMKAVIPVHTGLVDFLIKVISLRSSSPFDEDQQQLLIHHAHTQLMENGIVAVVDIANTVNSAAEKKDSPIFWHTCVELLGLRQAALNAMETMEKTLEAFTAPAHATAFTPHAPYSVLPDLFKKLNVATAGKLISIHNQESAAENELFYKGSGDFLKLFQFLGVGQNPLPVTGNSSLRSWLPYFTEGQRIILVHNTYTTKEDLQWAKEHAKKYGLQLFACLCPRANLYIENRLPPVNIFLEEEISIVLGTDSLASNSELSIAAEMNALRMHYPGFSIEQLLHWATSSGAALLNKSSEFGSFEPGMKPGILLLDEDTLAVKKLF